jgi:divalent metal cation (Fe/Co/Zn/Cd) transporter
LRSIAPVPFREMTSRSVNLRRALALSAFSIAWSGIAGTIAIYAALVGGSLSLLGFGVDALIDSAASVALIWRFLDEARQPEHAQRVERIAERVVGLALMVLALYLVLGSLRSLAGQTLPDTSTASVVLLAASILVLPALALAKYRVAGRLGSGALRADSILTAVAALLAAITLVSLAASSAFGLWWADAVAALVLATIVLREGWASLRLARSAT